MSPSRKLLILAGLALALWGMSDGLYFALFGEHQTLDHIGASLATSFLQAAQRKMPESRGALDAYSQANYVYVRQVDAHGHWIGLGTLLFVLGFAFDRLTFNERKRYLLALAMSIGALVFPLGVLLETVNRGPAPKTLAIVGSALIIFGLAGATLGFSKGERR